MALAGVHTFYTFSFLFFLYIYMVQLYHATMQSTQLLLQKKTSDWGRLLAKVRPTYSAFYIVVTYVKVNFLCLCEDRLGGVEEYGTQHKSLSIGFAEKCGDRKTDIKHGPTCESTT